MNLSYDELRDRPAPGVAIAINEPLLPFVLKALHQQSEHLAALTTILDRFNGMIRQGTDSTEEPPKKERPFEGFAPAIADLLAQNQEQIYKIEARISNIAARLIENGDRR